MMRTFLKWAGAVGMVVVWAGVAWGQNPTIAPTSLPNGEVGVFYSQTLTASETPATSATCCTWTASGLPDGLSIAFSSPNSTTAQISGTPTAAAAGAFSISVTATDVLLNGNQVYTGQIFPALQITTTSLPGGTQGITFSAPLAATGGTGSYTWSLFSVSPTAPWLSVSGSSLTASSPLAGTYTVTVQAADSFATVQSSALTLVISPPPLVVTTNSLPSGEASAPYPPPGGGGVTLGATGGSPPYHWAITSGALPAGLAFDTVGGVISAGPLSAGATTATGITFQVTDSASVTASSSSLTLTVTPGPSITTAATLPNAEAGAHYSGSLAASGGTGTGYTWSVGSPAPPAWLSIGSGGALSGTPPSAAGAASFGVKVVDSGGGSATQTFSITVNAGPSITTPSLAQGDAGSPYSQGFAASGGTMPYTWSIPPASLPNGITLNTSTGVVSGTTTSSGTFSITATVTDNVGGTASVTLPLTINPALTITTAPTLPNGTVGAAYSQTLGVSGGASSSYTWAIVGGALPGGLTPNGAAISGTPTGAGTFNFTAQVTDGINVSTTKQFTIIIANGLTIATAPTLPGGSVGTAYSQTLNAVGGTSPYTWIVTVGALPSGLGLNAATGAITGTPSSTGIFNFTVQVTDSASVKASKPFTLNIASSLVITTPAALPGGSVGVGYSVTLAASGGTPPYLWTVTNGTLPLGITLAAASGVLSGNPQSAGTFSFTVRVSDSASLVANQTFIVTMASGLAITTPPILPGGSVGVAYSQTLTAVGGTSPYQWLVNSGSPPGGINLNPSSGQLSGTPITSGTFTFTVLVTDNAANRATQQFTLVVGSGLAIITGSVLPPATIQTAYSQTLNAAGGRPPYTWAATAGTIPPGLKLGPDGSITGTATTAGTYHFTVQVTDKNSATTTQVMTLVVAATLTITTPGTLVGTVGSPFTVTFSASGGQAPYVWSVGGGSLPAGVTLNASTGVLSGTPTIGGSFTVSVQVVDSARLTASQTFSLSIGVPAPPKATVTGVPGTSTAAQQITFGVDLAASYAFDIEGTATITFEPDAVAPADDQTIQFATGGRTASFTIAANATQSSPIALQTGSVSGTITLAFTLQAKGVDLDASGLTQTIKIARAAPAIKSVSVTRSASGFTIQVVGLSTPRELTEVDLHFTAAAGANLKTTDLAESLTAVSKQWYQSQASAQFGSQFLLVLPITASQGSATAVSGVSVILKNSTGDSPPVSSTF